MKNKHVKYIMLYCNIYIFKLLPAGKHHFKKDLHAIPTTK